MDEIQWEPELPGYIIFDFEEALHHNGDEGDFLRSLSFSNACYELRGEATLLVATQVFCAMSQVAEEIVYRQSPSEKAVVIFSRQDAERVIRPHDVEILEWSKEELDEFSEQQRRDAQKELQMNLEEWWNEAKERNAQFPFQEFARRLYRMNPRKQEVNITGYAPLGAGLLAVQWFFQSKTPITIDKTPVASQV